MVFQRPIKVKRVLTPKRRQKWGVVEVELLVELRALKSSYGECALLTNRTRASCMSAVVDHNLYKLIKKRRKELLREVLL